MTMCKSIILNLQNVNYVTIIISILTMTAMILNNELIKPKLAKKCSFPVPIELAAIVIGTAISYGLNFAEVYDVRIIGPVPSGLPGPAFPSFTLLNSIWLDAIMIACVAYSISLSLGLIFAQKLNYEVNANQELLAQGLGNLFGSFFSCMPFAASLSRSSIQESVGGKTQIVSVVSAGILFVILMWISPLFETLPKCVLASVIIVSLKSMLFQMKDFFMFWSLSKLDAAVWLITFLTVTFIGIDVGLIAGVVMSLVCIIILGLTPYTCLLGWVPHTDLYLDIKRYNGITELLGLKIFHYQGSINFASKSFFKSALYNAIKVHPQKELQLRKKLTKLQIKDETSINNNPKSDLKQKIDKLRLKTCVEIRCLILDFSALSYIDPSGVSMLKLLSQEFKRIEIPIYIGGCSEPIYETMCKCDLLDSKKNYYKIFPTVHDAVQYASSACIYPSNISTIGRL